MPLFPGVLNLRPADGTTSHSAPSNIAHHHWMRVRPNYKSVEMYSSGVKTETVSSWIGVRLSLEVNSSGCIMLEMVDEGTVSPPGVSNVPATRLEVAEARGGTGSHGKSFRELQPGHRCEFSAGSELIVRAKA